MKYITFTEPGSAEVMNIAQSQDDLITQALTSDQVVINVHAAGVNGPDIKQREGAYPAPKGASPILGLEVSGEIIAVAEGVSQWQVGDKVCALVPGGGYAEQVVTFASHCLPIPKGYSFEQAAALPETCFTVWGNMMIRAGLSKGESVLIHGGSGGIGTTAIQIAKAMGARVFVTSGSDEKCQYCLQQGAELTINYHTQDFVEPILNATDGQGVNVVFDIAGGDFVNKNLKVVATDGRMVTVAMQRGIRAEVDIFRLMAKRISWTGSTLRPQSVEAKADIAAALRAQIWPLLDSGSINIKLDKIFAFEEVIAAHQYMESGQHQGKIVLKVI
ncbi:NAD(P)H-quinone oxidoreductase [Shewanella sp. MMG014]|uniref:NAD(P)H-quinone oxidoreductase n=1 Tax=Shewanella sp. MMG014 TaxID=2822691 RepID=UPI001B398268|nr:NAD(P)H-quinone oxidoreductase [Shewanella sp. MMG014]MBQ4890782.1 NAD(P)H-quinone oxidoreductase [Shewanella sp. MMG014]